MHRFIIKPEDTLLLSIGIQEQTFHALQEHNQQSLLDNCTSIIKTAHTLNLPIIASEQMPERSGPTLGAIATALGNTFNKIIKKTHSCWREGQIRAGIKDSTCGNVLIIGMQTHLCILQTVMDLLQTGYNPVVVADAVRSCQDLHHETALYAMAQAGAVIYPAESVISMLMESTLVPFINPSNGHAQGISDAKAHALES